MYPVLCRRFFLGEANQAFEEKFLREEVQVAYLYYQDNKPFIGFWPGVTGHENYSLEDTITRLRLNCLSFISISGTFGPTKWEHQDWCLCAGSVNYNKLVLTMETMNHLCRIFHQIHLDVP